MSNTSCKGTELLRVSSNTSPNSLAGAISHIIRNGNRADVAAIGASSVNQAVKAIAIANGYLTVNGIKLMCVPSFGRVEVDGLEKTTMNFLVESWE